MRGLACAALAVGLAVSGTVPAAPLEAYGGLPAIENARISPDGQTLAKVVTEDGQRFVDVEHIKPRETIVRFRAGAQKLRDLRWAGAHHLIIATSVTGKIENLIAARSEWSTAADFDLRRGVQRPLIWITSPITALNVITAEPVIRFIKDKPFAFTQGVSFLSGRGHTTVIKTDLDAGRSTLAVLGYFDAIGFVLDRSGAVIAQERYDPSNGRSEIEVWNGHWNEIEHEDTEPRDARLLGLGRDGASVLAAIPVAHTVVLREFRRDGSPLGDPLPVADSDMLVWDAATYRLIGAGNLVGDLKTFDFFAPEDEQAWKEVLANFPDQSVDLVSLADDHRRFVVRVDSPTMGPAYFLSDLNARTNDRIGVEHPTLNPADISEVHAISFKAADGLALTGYLTLPNGRDQKNLPLVVFPHGGPAARDEPGFDWWAQAMASRGYAVLQVNFRGSKGFGWVFQAAGFGQWGRKMQTDLSDGVRHLASLGVIDPKRVCIVGASYGGYAALAGATLDLGVYRCAVSVAGPADLTRMVLGPHPRRPPHDVGTQQFWLNYMGDKEHLADISPANQAANATIPILLIHGKDDTVVPYEQSQIMADALKKAGKPAEFVTLDSEDHWLSRGETRLQMLKATVAFLERNNPAR